MSCLHLLTLLRNKLFNNLNDFSKLLNSSIPHLWEFGASAKYSMHAKPFEISRFRSCFATRGSRFDRARKSLKRGEFCGRLTTKSEKEDFWKHFFSQNRVKHRALYGCVKSISERAEGTTKACLRNCFIWLGLGRRGSAVGSQGILN